MPMTRTLIGAVGAMAAVAGLTIVGAGAAGAAPRPATVPLAGSTAPFIAHSRVLGAVPASKRLTIQVWLRPRITAAERYATAVSTPGNPLYHHYLSPDGYAARFAASKAVVAKVAAWLRSQGFTGAAADGQRDYVRATAAASTVAAAFRTKLKIYQASAAVNAGASPLMANSLPVRLPRSLAGEVLGVTGLVNALPVLPLAYPDTRPGSAGSPKPPHYPCSAYYGQHVIKNLPKHFGVTSFPTDVCGYSARQLRSAYGASFANGGKGQTVALIELGLTPDMFLTLQDYARANNMPAPSPRRYAELSLGRGTACGDFFDIEEQLDVEASYDMAPAASQLVVGGDSCNNGDQGLQGLFDADIAVLGGNGTHPLATVASNSWEGGTESQAAYLTDIEHAYLVRAAAEGVGMYFSSGDASGVETPSSDPYAIAVGGTTLGIGKTGNRLFETGWSTGISGLAGKHWVFLGEQGAAGGGTSLLWQEPAYQVGVVPAALTTPPGNRGGPVRSVPDVSADADPYTGMAVGILNFPRNKPPQYVQIDVGGTSLASPLVAGMVTAAQQGQGSSFGFINPDLYKLSGTSAITDTLPLTSASPAFYRGTVCDVYTCGLAALTTFDDQNPNMYPWAGQVTLPGYDNMSGVGTPNGQQFIAALRGLG
jgi:subtilase family serine protease